MGFVRTTAGQWNDFSMAINSRYPFLPDRRVAGDAVMGVGEIQQLRKRMAVEPAENSIELQLAQFLPERRELWIDYLTIAQRRFRQWREVSVGQCRGASHHRHRNCDQFNPDIPLDPMCDAIQFTDRKH
jgi:hypothetical protein